MTKTTRKPRSPRFVALLEKEKQAIAAQVEDQSSSRALDKYIAGLGKYVNKPFGKFLEALERDGASDSLRGKTVAEVFGPIFAKGKGKGRGRKALAAGGRLSKAEKAKLQEEILEFLKAHPDSKRKDVAKGLKVDKKKLFSAMKSLLAEKKLATKGVRAGMTYCARG